MSNDFLHDEDTSLDTLSPTKEQQVLRTLSLERFAKIEKENEELRKKVEKYEHKYEFNFLWNGKYFQKDFVDILKNSTKFPHILFVNLYIRTNCITIHLNLDIIKNKKGNIWLLYDLYHRRGYANRNGKHMFSVYSETLTEDIENFFKPFFEEAGHQLIIVDDDDECDDSYHPVDIPCANCDEYNCDCIECRKENIID
jgi:hypothetical protein